jgi:hypothetical protein
LKFSAFKTNLDSSLPVPQKDLILLYAEDVYNMPVTNERGILAANEVKLKNGANTYNLYLTPEQQKYSVDAEGDLDVKGWIPTISGSFPGTELSISEWLHNNINRKFVVVQRNCEKGYSKIYGHPYNPLFLTGKISQDKDRSLCEITLTAAKKTKRPYIIYSTKISGNILSPNPVSNSVLLIDIIGKL